MISELEDIALEAGQAILPLFHAGNFETSLKSDQTPVTSADILADQIISLRLKALLDVPILSEEREALKMQGKVARFWIIDPIDGTKEFLQHRPTFTVNIALIEDGVPVAGVVYAPALDELYAGSLAKGLRINRQTAPKPSWPAEPTLLSSRSHPEAELEAFMRAEGYTQKLTVGSSIKFCWVAQGRAHCYPRFRSLSIWDIAAGHAVATAAGCRVLSFASGLPLLYSYYEHKSPPFCLLAPERQLHTLFPDIGTG